MCAKVSSLGKAEITSVLSEELLLQATRAAAVPPPTIH